MPTSLWLFNRGQVASRPLLYGGFELRDAFELCADGSFVELLQFPKLTHSMHYRADRKEDQQRNIFTYYWMRMPQILHSWYFVLQLMHEYTCLHGMYRQSRSTYRHDAQAFELDRSTISAVFFLHRYVKVVPNRKIALLCSRYGALSSPSGDSLSHVLRLVHRLPVGGLEILDE